MSPSCLFRFLPPWESYFPPSLLPLLIDSPPLLLRSHSPVLIIFQYIEASDEDLLKPVLLLNYSAENWERIRLMLNFILYIILSGLQITVGHRTMTNQILLMLDEISTVVGHNGRTIFFWPCSKHKLVYSALTMHQIN